MSNLSENAAVVGHEFYEHMEKNNLILIYEGEFSQQVMKSVLAMTEKNFDETGVDAFVKKKVFNVMVEVLQNICKHQHVEGLQDPALAAIFMIGLKDNNYSIISGNLILNEFTASLQHKLDGINALDKEGLKDLYKSVRLNATISTVGGAGLGFIDIARKSANKIQYLFKPVNDQVSYFYLSAKVSATKDAAE